MHARSRMVLGLASLLVSLAPSARADEPAFEPLGVNPQGALAFNSTKDGARLLWIPPGAFKMNQYHRPATDDPPSRPLFVDGFAIDETEVTNRRFAAFLNELGRDRDEQGHA